MRIFDEFYPQGTGHGHHGPQMLDGFFVFFPFGKKRKGISEAPTICYQMVEEATLTNSGYVVFTTCATPWMILSSLTKNVGVYAQLVLPVSFGEQRYRDGPPRDVN